MLTAYQAAQCARDLGLRGAKRLEFIIKSVPLPSGTEPRTVRRLVKEGGGLCLDQNASLYQKIKRNGSSRVKPLSPFSPFAPVKNSESGFRQGLGRCSERHPAPGVDSHS